MSDNWAPTGTWMLMCESLVRGRTGVHHQSESGRNDQRAWRLQAIDAEQLIAEDYAELETQACTRPLRFSLEASQRSTRSRATPSPNGFSS